MIANHCYGVPRTWVFVSHISNYIVIGVRVSHGIGVKIPHSTIVSPVCCPIFVGIKENISVCSHIAHGISISNYSLSIIIFKDIPPYNHIRIIPDTKRLTMSTSKTISKLPKTFQIVSFNQHISTALKYNSILVRILYITVLQFYVLSPRSVTAYISTIICVFVITMSCLCSIIYMDVF